METQQQIPTPKGGLQLVVFNVLSDAGRPLTANGIWDRMPEELHKPHGRIKLSKALSNMCSRGILTNVSLRSRTGLYRIATVEENAAKAAQQKRVAKAGKRKAKRKAKKVVGPITREVVGRIDARIAELEGRITDLKALRDLTIQADL